MDIITSIKTKADAMAFAIEQSGGDLGKADTIFRMFVDNMELPDTATTAADSCFKNLADATEALTRRINARLTESAEPELAEVADEKTPSTIILPGMPGLEWMTENLSGFGGTEVDGHTYYTYDQAEEAVKQLGDGWRLPTQEEFEALCDLGSTWDEERKGRWFGGNHDTDHADSLFLPAAGCRGYTSGALEYVGTNGYAWSSSSYAAGNVGAGMLYFNSGNVSPLVSGNRAIARAVRCVRNRQ